MMKLDTTHTTLDLPRSPAHTAHLRPGLWRRLADVVAILARWRRRRRTRRSLATLEPRLLQDVGLTSEDARSECRKWFFQW